MFGLNKRRHEDSLVLPVHCCWKPTRQIVCLVAIPKAQTPKMAFDPFPAGPSFRVVTLHQLLTGFCQLIFQRSARFNVGYDVPRQLGALHRDQKHEVRHVNRCFVGSLTE